MQSWRRRQSHAADHAQRPASIRSERLAISQIDRRGIHPPPGSRRQNHFQGGSAFTGLLNSCDRYSGAGTRRPRRRSSGAPRYARRRGRDVAAIGSAADDNAGMDRAERLNAMGIDDETRAIQRELLTDRCRHRRWRNRGRVRSDHAVSRGRENLFDGRSCGGEASSEGALAGRPLRGDFHRTAVRLFWTPMARKRQRFRPEPAGSSSSWIPSSVIWSRRSSRRTARSRTQPAQAGEAALAKTVVSVRPGSIHCRLRERGERRGEHPTQSPCQIEFQYEVADLVKTCRRIRGPGWWRHQRVDARRSLGAQRSRQSSALTAG